MSTDDAVLARLLQTADKVEIIEVLSRYHQLVDSQDLDSLDAVFTDDARCEYLGQAELFGNQLALTARRSRPSDTVGSGIGTATPTARSSPRGAPARTCSRHRW